MALPSGVERMLFALGMTTFMSLIGRMGAEALAASNIILNLFLVALLPAMGFGIASATFVARSVGAEQPHEARHWQRAVAVWALGALSTLSLLFALAPRWVATAFTTDPATLNMAQDTLVLMAFILPMEALHMVVYQSLLGLGDNRFVMAVSLSAQWLVTLPLVYCIAELWGLGVWWAWGVHFLARGGQCLSYHLRWSHKLRHLEGAAEG
jgi:Na+-driven multidrug efflux pump